MTTLIAKTRMAVALWLLAHGTACVDAPIADPEPQARIVVAWDPLACGEPHRVVFELEDSRGARYARSTPCELGGMTLELVHWGVYRGRIYAWTLGPEIRSELAVRLEVDAPVIYWFVDTPR